MKLSKEIRIGLLLLLLIITFGLLFIFISEKNAMQRDINLIFINAISDSMDGLSKDYSKLDTVEKVQYYNTVTSNLKDALDVFHNTSYKENDDLFEILNRIYIYLLQNRNENYEIEHNGLFFEILGKLQAYPDDVEQIREFNDLLDNKLTK